MQSAIVTGATSGIGRAAAVRFAREGWGVLAVARDVRALDALSQTLGADGGHCVPFAADVTDPENAPRIVDTAVKAFGGLHALVNAAGIIASGSVETTNVEEGDYMMAVNVRAPLVLMQAAIPALTPTRGAIVNVSSVAGLRAFPNLLVYCVSKAALDQLTRCAALDLAPKGIRVNAVNPGVVVTNLHRRSGMSEDAYSAFLEHSKTTHPLGRAGDPDEIADLIFYLASDRASWITGETISIDGGRHLTCAR
jgi:NAD(P)-dependent dehydrogenase (short-subunit alcohol dehydrogenase family)